MNKIHKHKLKVKAIRYLEKNVSLVKNVNPGRAARVLQALGAAPGDIQEKGFTLTKHTEAGLSHEAQRNEILQFFLQK